MNLSGLLRAVRSGIEKLGEYYFASKPQLSMEEFLEREEDELIAIKVEEGFEEEPVKSLEPGYVELHRNAGIHAMVIDGSSKIIRCAHANIIIASVAMLSTRGSLADYPPHLAPRDLGEAYELFREPFISLQPKVELGEDGWGEVEEVFGEFVRLKSLAGYYYDYGYSTWQIMDEARLSLETKGLELALDQGAKLVLLDGPLHPLPRILFRKSYKGIAHYVESYVEVARKRAELFDRAKEKGVAVIGLVKRVSGSFKLYRVPQIRDLLLKVTGKRPSRLSDDQVISLLVHYLVESGRIKAPISIVVVGSLRMELDGLAEHVKRNLEGEGKRVSDIEFPQRELYYAWVPVHPYVPSRGSVVRFETTHGFYRERGVKGFLDILDFVLSLGVNWRKGVPKLLDMADMAARRTARSYFVTFARGVEDVTTLLYETRVELEVEEVGREV